MRHERRCRKWSGVTNKNECRLEGAPMAEASGSTWIHIFNGTAVGEVS